MGGPLQHLPTERLFAPKETTLLGVESEAPIRRHPPEGKAQRGNGAMAEGRERGVQEGRSGLPEGGSGFLHPSPRSEVRAGGVLWPAGRDPERGLGAALGGPGGGGAAAPGARGALGRGETWRLGRRLNVKSKKVEKPISRAHPRPPSLVRRL